MAPPTPPHPQPSLCLARSLAVKDAWSEAATVLQWQEARLSTDSPRQQNMEPISIDVSVYLQPCARADAVEPAEPGPVGEGRRGGHVVADVVGVLAIFVMEHLS